jgi:GNAT superfamily N-acetyltransferase
VIVRKAGSDRADLDGVSRALAAAFQDDPVMAWIWPDADDRRARLPKLYRQGLRYMWLRNGLVYTTGDHAGAAVWAPPGKWKLGALRMVRLSPKLLAVAGRAIFRVLRTSNMIERNHLAEPHYYLFALGTTPAAQGRGVGAALLKPMLARCDAEGLPAYLESSNERNVPFYLRHGFRVLGEERLPDGPPLIFMRRG